MEKQEKEPSEAAFDDVKWENVVVNGSELLINGKNGKALKSKDLRRICSRLKMRGVKNATKETMIQRIIDMHSNRGCLRLHRQSTSDRPSLRTGRTLLLRAHHASDIRRRILPPLRTALRAVLNGIFLRKVSAGGKNFR